MVSPRVFTIRVPASTANFGPGFDVLGAGLSLYLVLTVSVPGQQSEPSIDTLPYVKAALTYTGDSVSSVPLDPTQNLITKVATYVASAHQHSLPSGIQVHIDNSIPLSRGLGSSGAAVVAGVALANMCCRLGMDTQALLDYACLLEGHPDNVAASLVGGLVTSYLKYDIQEEVNVLQTDTDLYLHNRHHHRQDKRLVCHESGDERCSKDTDGIPRPRFGGIAAHRKLRLSSAIRVVVAIPTFEVSTHKARSVLPPMYSRADVVFNMQHLAMLVHVLGDDHPDGTVVWESMQDRVHQPHRQILVPGLKEVLRLSGNELPGLLGVCLSGAGPTVLALATDNFDQIGQHIVNEFQKHPDANGVGIQAHYLVLDFDRVGMVVEEK
ncbi:hypothetical protein BASA61_008408 [Batrachochytrium salamandrivorans]|nr:hypothetical protein BASA60_010188 [Batrachochytrium salamandrivorans]KAH6576749.1 hypothetical protein BASA62_001200 [Batrachochytrium salamandrivorans]KAH6582658.1 hypothetical protein BASA61_008408 [Batrachochytrium salamandrivorans]KAH9269940.1 homoserine kinase [Batrachochytrium salamandrivorans]KAJ1344548.1 homoserine kinase [Batrachochytrium salamandrivorans]